MEFSSTNKWGRFDGVVILESFDGLPSLDFSPDLYGEDGWLVFVNRVNGIAGIRGLLSTGVDDLSSGILQLGLDGALLGIVGWMIVYLQIWVLVDNWGRNLRYKSNSTFLNCSCIACNCFDRFDSLFTANLSYLFREIRRGSEV
mgnify:FL=1